MAQAGEAEQALQLAAVVLHHPASTQEAKDQAEKLRAALQLWLTPQQVQAAQARALASRLEDLAQKILAPG